jgi:hypothetical protein
MTSSSQDTLAPCVVVAGPAHSGKSTFLHQLDQALQTHGSRPEVYIVKGSPDATGRWLYHMPPEQRSALERQLKGVWTPEAVEMICLWILSARRHLGLVLVDLGGKLGPLNPMILGCCTHYILLARKLETEEQEQQEGMSAWDCACSGAGLVPVARIRSLWKDGQAGVTQNESSQPLEATYRADAAVPGDTTNDAVIAAVVERLLKLRLERTVAAYLNLRLERDWETGDLVDLAGLLPQLQQQARQDGRVRLGGRAPIWAYAAAVHRALDVNPKAVIEVFEPKLPSGFVRIPDAFSSQTNSASSWDDWLEVCLRNSPWGPKLELKTITPERMLPLSATFLLGAVPLPEFERPERIFVSGAVPIWLHLAYSRRLRQWGVKEIGHWDGRLQQPVFIYREGAGKAGAAGLAAG